MTVPPLVLASASPARARMLRAAGLVFETAPAGVDEAGVREAVRAEGADAAAAAMALAVLKASRISADRAGALVVGADQMLTCEGRWFGKPADFAAARRQLQDLRGRVHRLETAACAALDGAIVWRAATSARLVMRRFSDRFLDRYIADCGGEVLSSVGAYRIEGRGAQLFTEVEGDLFTILGLPLLALLAFLRERGLAPR